MGFESCKDNSLYINIRDENEYSITDTIELESLIFDLHRLEQQVVIIIGIEILNNQVLPKDVKISCQALENFTIVKFLDNITEDVLNMCIVEQLYDTPVQIYRDTNDDTLVQIVVYETINDQDIFSTFSKFTGLRLVL